VGMSGWAAGVTPDAFRTTCDALPCATDVRASLPSEWQCSLSKKGAVRVDGLLVSERRIVLPLLEQLEKSNP